MATIYRHRGSGFADPRFKLRKYRIVVDKRTRQSRLTRQLEQIPVDFTHSLHA
jgi:hypothetical protein